jgi:hypothetical protein
MGDTQATNSCWVPERVSKMVVSNSVAMPHGLNKPRKKSKRKANSAKDGLAGAESPAHFAGFIGTTKVVPCYKAPWVEFFRKL